MGLRGSWEQGVGGSDDNTMLLSDCKQVQLAVGRCSYHIGNHPSNWGGIVIPTWRTIPPTRDTQRLSGGGGGESARGWPGEDIR